MIEARLLFGGDTVDIQLPDRAQLLGGGDGAAAGPRLEPAADQGAAGRGARGGAPGPPPAPPPPPPPRPPPLLPRRRGRRKPHLPWHHSQRLRRRGPPPGSGLGP